MSPSRVSRTPGRRPLRDTQGIRGKKLSPSPRKLTLVNDPEWTEDQALAIEEGFFDPEFDGTFPLDTLGEYVDDLRYGTGEWYKNPIVLTGAGVALFLVLRRR